MEQINEWKSFYADLDLKKEHIEKEIFRCNQIITANERNKKAAMDNLNKFSDIIIETQNDLKYLQSQLK